MDLTIIHWISENLRNPFLDRIMVLVTTLGGSVLFWAIVCIGLLAFPKTRRWGVMCALSLLLMLVAGEGLLKHIFQRARPFTHLPELELLVPAPITFSFPSSHSAAAFAASTVVFFWDRKWGAAALATAALVAFSRMYLSVHYPTDVLAGVLLGVACAFTARWLMEWREQRGRGR